MKNILILSFLSSLLFIGCAQKTQVRAIKSAKVTDSSIRYIGVAPFINDNIAQSSQIDSALNNLKIKDEKYFTVIDRQNIDKIMQEKRLNDSGLVNLINDESSNGLSQMQTLLTGKVNVNDVSSSNFYESRTDYDICIQTYKKDGKTHCSKYRTYNVGCRTKAYNVQTKVKLIKISNATTTFANNYKASIKYKHCSDDSNILPNKIITNTKLANDIAQKLLIDIAPSYIYFEVVLLDDEDVDFNDEEEKLFENALEMIKYKRIKKANKMLNTLNTNLKYKSYVVLYDLSITEESLGNVHKAYELLQKAEDISLPKDGVIKEIVIAIKRVKKSILEKEKAQKQINKI